MTAGSSPAPFKRHVFSNRSAAVEAALTPATDAVGGDDPSEGAAAGG